MRTNTEIATMSGIRMALWNHNASSPIGVTCGWKPMAPVGWPTVASGEVRAIVLLRTLALEGSSSPVSAPLTCSGWAGAAWLLALIASIGCCVAAAGAAAGEAGAAAGAAVAGACCASAAGAMPKAAATAKSLRKIFI
jgi:hypothetical protein